MAISQSNFGPKRRTLSPLDGVFVRLLKGQLVPLSVTGYVLRKGRAPRQSELQTAFTFSNSLNLLAPAGQLTPLFLFLLFVGGAEGREKEKPHCHSALSLLCLFCVPTLTFK